MLSINPGLMIWTLITFALAVFVLWRFAFGPLQRIIDERRAEIQGNIDAAAEAQAEAVRLREEYVATLAKARGESEEILAQSRNAAEDMKDEIVAAAKEQSERIVARAHEQIERDTRAALRDIKGQIAELTALATEKVAGSSLSATDQRRLIDEALAELDAEKLGAEGRS
ncbi:MAG: F0F1 ATP synthase subunit B [Alphaproteobacteria bacterium]|nr:F0F1 ATP synthase subunit B [Alphaproteobacteria bacterium]